MDQRVCDVMRQLREQELPAGDLQAITPKIIFQSKQRKSLKELAQQVGLSESRLCVLFKSDVGLTPNQYVKKLKIDAAAKLISETYMRVAEVVAILRVNDTSHFLRDFKKAYGMTPTEYRKLHQRRSGEENGTENGASS